MQSGEAQPVRNTGIGALGEQRADGIGVIGQARPSAAGSGPARRYRPCQAATSPGRSVSLPPVKVAPARTRATRWGALTARQRSCAALPSASATSPTASPYHSWKPAASDSGYTPRVGGGTFTDMAAKVKKVKEQNLAVFGESGSGKTVLLSSFYGASQESSFLAESLYKVLADDTGQGTRLRQNYLRMRNQAEAPKTNRFTATPYSFTLKLKDPGDAKAAKAKPFNALRLIWHDYPGEWFTEEPSSTEEAARRVETFTRLLKSDVALVLVDGQKLLDYEGEEEKYLKSLLWGLRDGLEKLRDDILTDGEPLTEFPRIWILALSKADLHPGLNAEGFQDLIVEKAAGDVSALHDTLKTFVQVPEALSLGEDFMLLSSARFELDKIEVTERVGLDLILPVATMLPFERLAQWAGKFDIPLKVLGGLVDHADALAALLTGSGAAVAVKFLTKIPKFGPVLAPIAIPALAEAVKLSKSKLEEVHAQALANRDFLTAVVTQFRLDLDHGVEDHLFVKSLW